MAIAIRRALLLAAAGMGAALASPAAAKDCAELKGATIGSGTVTAATLVEPGAFAPPAGSGPPPGVAASGFKAMPAFCRVQATLKPSADSDIKVEVWLPASGWNGKFVGIGNGIWAGTISFSEMAGPLARGYAVAATDTGHAGNGLTADFAVGHPEKLVDFGHRAVHEMTVAAKAAVANFYGSAPKLSFWNSCSTGGRQGLMEAYRYPADYDAISAMAPANPMTALMTQTVWTGWQAVRDPAAAGLAGKLAGLHKAVVAACDAGDGVKDGLVSDPTRCRFDPASVQCKGADGPDCLNPAQVAAMRGIYGGVRDPRTGKQTFAGFPLGSEKQLAVLISAPEPFPVATSYFRQLVFADQPGWDFKSFDYGADAAKGTAFGAGILDVPADGLNPFFARGGKLLMSHGWSDGLIPANNSVSFYGALTRAVPKDKAAKQLRLFMVPAMDHCSGGEGPSQFDTIAVIDAWATTGTAPERIEARTPPNLPPVSRPLCPFPMVAELRGQGDPSKAESFSCAAAKKS